MSTGQASNLPLRMGNWRSKPKKAAPGKQAPTWRMSLPVSNEPTLSVCMSLSMPRGPSVVLTVSTTAMQALMLLTSWALPWLVSVPSFRRIIWGCYKDKQMQTSGACRDRKNACMLGHLTHAPSRLETFCCAVICGSYTRAVQECVKEEGWGTMMMMSKVSTL